MEITVTPQQAVKYSTSGTASASCFASLEVATRLAPAFVVSTRSALRWISSYKFKGKTE